MLDKPTDVFLIHAARMQIARKTEISREAVWFGVLWRVQHCSIECLTHMPVEGDIFAIPEQDKKTPGA